MSGELPRHLMRSGELIGGRSEGMMSEVARDVVSLFTDQEIEDICACRASARPPWSESLRLWSLHPKYLDARGLVALWREGLLAQAVLRGETKGYVHHPQLLRFREQESPVGSIAEYLRGIHAEAASRGYRFAAGKISRARARGPLAVTREQLEFEWDHLREKLRKRDPERLDRLATVKRPAAHSLFRVVRGCVATWERAARFR